VYRIGIAGLGEHGSRHAADALAVDDAVLAAIAEVDDDRRRTAGEEFGVPPAERYADAAALIDEGSLDAVVVASPPAFHRDQILAALDAGLDVCCEKPLVVSTAEAREVADRVGRGPETLLVGYQRHWNPGYVAARDRWRDADREPHFATGELTQDWTHHFESRVNWRTDPEIAGYGHLFSVGTHVLEAMLWATGLSPTAVAAEMEFADDHRPVGERSIDAQASLTIRFENGATATMADCATATAHREHLHVWDEDGGAFLEARNWESPRLSVVDGGDTERTPDLDYDGAPSTVETFVDAIETGDPPATARDALRVTALLEAAYESARTGERVAVELG